MFNSSVLDVAIGLAFVYLLLGLMCTTINEWIASLMSRRANNLKEGISRLLTDPALYKLFYSHPLIKSLMPPEDGKSHPSYIPARTFSTALMDIVNSSQTGPSDFAGLLQGVNALPDSDVKKSLHALLQNVNNDLALAQKGIETWFNDGMDRISGAYKRDTQIITICIAAVITILANADTVQIANKLYVNPVLREAVVASAKESAKDKDGAAQKLTAQQMAQLGQLDGWAEEFRTFHDMVGISKNQKPAPPPSAGFPGLEFFTEFGTTLAWLWAIVPGHLVGWILSSIAVSLGAPFWFDTLNRFMNIRAAGKSPNEQGKGAASAS